MKKFIMFLKTNYLGYLSQIALKDMQLLVQITEVASAGVEILIVVLFTMTSAEIP